MVPVHRIGGSFCGGTFRRALRPDAGGIFPTDRRSNEKDKRIIIDSREVFLLGKKYLIFAISTILGLFLTACLPENSPTGPSRRDGSETQSSITPGPLLSSTKTVVEIPDSPTISETPTPKTIPTFLPSASPTIGPTSSPVPVRVAHDAVNVPILLYHHIADHTGNDQDYYTGPSAFQNQMQRLKDWGYTAIGISQLTTAIRNEAPLPDRPIVITFDDGNLDVYQNALPILKKHGFPAVMYIILKYLGSDQHLTIVQVQELATDGWEIGSHSYTHTDLRKSNDLQKEICLSKYTLSKDTGLEIRTFAYPYGLADNYLTQFARDCGYTSAVGLGPSFRQSAQNLYFLNRLTVLGGWTLDEFSSHLPWRLP
jgi:peptidoglycan/xylan/chitin deacetylase (PgdA/CDA1 family)